MVPIYSSLFVSNDNRLDRAAIAREDDKGAR